jgi:hypothetical protein
MAAAAGRPHVLFIPSPFVGRGIWRAAAEALDRATGWAADIADASPNRVEPPFYPNLARRIVAGCGFQPGARTVVVAHSGAGGLVAPIAEALQARANAGLAAVILVDAILPHPGRSWFACAPAGLGDRLRSMIEDGRAPPWDRWFAPRVLERLLPDPEVRGSFIADIEPVPAAYLDELAPASGAWPPARRAYLQLSGAYDVEAAECAAAGWLVRRDISHHLAMIDQPARVAESLRSMINALIAAD